MSLFPWTTSQAQQIGSELDLLLWWPLVIFDLQDFLIIYRSLKKTMLTVYHLRTLTLLLVYPARGPQYCCDYKMLFFLILEWKDINPLCIDQCKWYRGQTKKKKVCFRHCVTLQLDEMRGKMPYSMFNKITAMK